MFFRLLGLVAALDSRLNRIRINFVPLNLALAGALLWGASLGVARVAQGPAETVPREVTVADLAAGRVPTGTFVRVSGLVDRDLVMEVGSGGKDGRIRTVRERLRLLHDAGAPAIWLRAPNVDQAFSGRATFVGIVRPLPTGVAAATAREGGALFGRQPSTGSLMEHGVRPRSYGSGLAYLLTCAPPLALLAWVWIARRQIFRAGQRSALDAGSPDEPIDLRVSGRMRLEARVSRRFVEAPAGLQWIENGGVGVVADIDASSYVMGAQAVARQGLWLLPIPAGATLSVVFGELAFGTGVRPAARIDVRVGGRTTDRLTLTFGSLSQRDRVVRTLSSIFSVQPGAAAA